MRNIGVLCWHMLGWVANVHVVAIIIAMVNNLEVLKVIATHR